MLYLLLFHMTVTVRRFLPGFTAFPAGSDHRLDLTGQTRLNQRCGSGEGRVGSQEKKSSWQIRCVSSGLETSWPTVRGSL